MNQFRLLLVILAIPALASCRLAIETRGGGLVYGELSEEVYHNGHVLDINEDFDERFYPVPHPGHSFRRWRNLCENLNEACPLTLREEAWEQDEEFALRAHFAGRYDGPLRLSDIEMWWYPLVREFGIPLESLEISGLARGAEPMVFMASFDLQHTITAQRSGDEYRFPLPAGEEPDDYWPFVTARDTQGSIASVSFEFDMRDFQRSQLEPHNANSRWADDLASCAVANSPFEVCTFNRLPFIGSQSAPLDVRDIMARTVVSHRWMGRRFRQVLKALPPELLQMFGTVTAVVISSDVRPSFYLPATGAIYLDPQDLWLTTSERDSISTEPDYRGAYGSSLELLPYWLYLKGGTEAWIPSSAWPRGYRRTIDDIKLPMATLLIHELTHANDTVPPAQLVHALGRVTPLALVNQIYNLTPNWQLSNTYPLYSPVMYDLAATLYHGQPAGPETLNLSARQAGLAFDNDVANDLYAYATSAEDTAMLVEEVLSHHFFGLERLTAFLDIPANLDNPSCDDYILRWGSRNRVFETSVKQRARLVLSGVLDESDLSAYLGNTPRYRKLRPGDGICDYFDFLSLGNPSRGQSIAVWQRAGRQIDQVRRHSQVHGMTGERRKKHADH